MEKYMWHEMCFFLSLSHNNNFARSIFGPINIYQFMLNKLAETHIGPMKNVRYYSIVIKIWHV